MIIMLQMPFHMSRSLKSKVANSLKKVVTVSSKNHYCMMLYRLDYSISSYQHNFLPLLYLGVMNHIAGLRMYLKNLNISNTVLILISIVTVRVCRNWCSNKYHLRIIVPWDHGIHFSDDRKKPGLMLHPYVFPILRIANSIATEMLSFRGRSIVRTINSLMNGRTNCFHGRQKRTRYFSVGLYIQAIISVLV